MKKTYITPKAIIVNIESQSILAGSDLRLGTPGDGGDALGRRHRYVDYDEEEEW